MLKILAIDENISAQLKKYNLIESCFIFSLYRCLFFTEKVY